MKPARFAILCMLAFSLSALADPGVSEDSVTIGQSIGITGPVASVGQEIAAGLAASFHAVNKGGGVNGRMLKLETMDDGFVPPRTGANAKALIERTFLIAAPLGTPHTLEALKITSPAQVPVMCPFTGSELLRGKFDRYLFNLRTGYMEEVSKMIEQLTTSGVNRVAMFYQNDAFGQEGLRHVEVALKARSLAVVAAVPIERGSVEVGPAVKAFAKVQPQAVIMFTTTRPSAELVKQLSATGVEPQYLTISQNGTDEFVSLLGERQRGVIVSGVVPSPWAGVSPTIKEYQQAMRETGKDKFSFNSLEGYMCGKIIAEGLRRVPRKQLSRERFVEALEGLNAYGLGEFEVGYSPKNHAGSKFVDLMVIDARGRFQR